MTKLDTVQGAVTEFYKELDLVELGTVVVPKLLLLGSLGHLEERLVL